jgi:hypothetical protein
MEKLWTCQSYMPYQSDIRWPSRGSAQKLLSFIPLERKIKRENRRVKRGETTRRKTGLRVSSSSNSQMWKEKYERKIKIKATVVERGGVVWTGRLYSKTYIHVHIQRKRRNTQKKQHIHVVLIKFCCLASLSRILGVRPLFTARFVCECTPSKRLSYKLAALCNRS